MSVSVVVCAFTGHDATSVTVIAGVWLGELSACNASYFKKASKENAVKLYKSMPKDMKESIDVNGMINNT